MEAQRPLFDASPAPPPAPGRTAAEFFAGVGLARMGLERAGWEVTLANDLDPKKLAMHDGHFGPSPHYLLEDVHKLAIEPERVPTTLLSHASFPCTDLSLAGGRRGLNSGESSAFWGWHALLEGMGDRRPPIVLVENVTGFLTSHNGEDFFAALAALGDLGYTVDALTIDAAHFTPQSRPRLFVIGSRGVEPDLPAIDADDLAPSPLRSAKLVEAIRRSPQLGWRLAALPELPPYGATPLESILERLPSDSPQWWSRERSEYLLGQMSERHRAEADKMIAGKSLSFGTVFRRVRKGKSMAELRTDGLAGCLRTPKGGSGRQILFQAGKGEYRVRLLNATECARLMGADGYRVTAPLNQALFGFGDAVCVDAVAWIAENYLNPLADAVLASASSAAPVE
ncbi:Modification methylase HhaI [Pseudobythopirellula maris]|uniref:DNA (cytosine-5-)-methyltransferase n=1 Tax=Pseudobythopirellula maris TaxID=2527991 RepID=A0A5C5ZSA2_9BACT|nr:DNA (cytosine-5-)-methyltransferase [Pseudobythopirellula maris]TWT89948.1 Modification methylase HhaI [Pseudobythopirellula maris]